MHDLEHPSLRVKVSQVCELELAGSEPCAEHEGDDELRHLRPPTLEGVQCAQRISKPILVLHRTRSVSGVGSPPLRLRLEPLHDFVVVEKQEVFDGGP